MPLYDIDAEEDWDDIEDEKETDGRITRITTEMLCDHRNLI